MAEYPPLLRFILWIGKPLGYAFVPEDHVQVISHMGQYGGVRGPGLIRYNRLTETLGPLVNTGGAMREGRFDGVMSRDAVPVSITLGYTFAYDPRNGPKLASVLTRLPREAYEGIARPFIQWCLLAVANKYNATELTQRDVTTQVEKDMGEMLAAEMSFLGIQVRRVRVMGVQLPATLADRQAIIAQRRASILAGTEFHPAEFRKALVTEVIENLGRTGAGESFVNFSEMLEAYAAERKEKLPGRVIENPAQRTKEDDTNWTTKKPRSRL